MDIFKLGDKILALLEAVFGFWNNQISLVFAMLGQSPVSFKGGGPWAVIEGIEPVFVAVGSSLVVLFFVIGFCSESIDVKDEMRFESIFRMLIRLGLAEWFVANNVTIMKAFFTSIGNLVGLISAGTTTQLACNHHYYLWILYHLHSVFQVLKDTDYCAAWCDCMLHNGRKQNGQSYNGYLLQIFSFVCIRGSNDGTCNCGM